MRGLASTALLALSVTVVLATGGAAEGGRLALVAGAAVAARALLLVPAVTRAFGTFAPALDLGVSLALVLAALSLTGGAMSDLYPLVLVEIALARLFEGPGAARFLALAVLAGVLALAAPVVIAGAVPLLPLALRIFWPAAFLVALEAAGDAAGGAPAKPVEPAPVPASARMEPRMASASRDARQEILHDLKSPLSVIRVYTDLIAESARRGEPPRPDHLSNLENEVALMEAMAGAPRPTRPPAPRPPSRPTPRADLVSLLGSLADAYRATHGEKLRIEFLAEEPEILVAADPVAVQRAFRNVLENAVKYTPPGGQVRIRASVVSQHAFAVISDTGVGMDAEEQKRAFEYAYRGPAAQTLGAEGRGFGLALAHELLEQNGGKISLLSEPGHGLEVTIMFPVLKGARV